MNQHLCTDKTEWQSALARFPEANFLSSWEWGQFQESLGKKVDRVVGTVDETVVAAALLVTEVAKRGTYVACAGGPLVNWESLQETTAFFEIIKKYAQEHHAVFIRFRPQALTEQVSAHCLQLLGARLAPMHLTADFTLQLDLTKTAEQLLSEMRKNTRYEVRRAEKLGITTEFSQNPEDLREFYTHQLELATKHGFVPFSHEFLLQQFQSFLETDSVVLVHAKQQNTLLASAFIIFYNGEAVYHYGISTPVNDKLPGAYAAQWAAILEAQRRGCTRYNFWGVTQATQVDHRFSGVSLFKRGFGGFEVGYLPAHDIPLQPQYWITYLFELVRKKLRKL
jgi:lipid II:glycine glycyltransferase (peptidoglycan interpeptide bridge formation enzyme)